MNQSLIINIKMNTTQVAPKDEPPTTAKVILTTTNGEIEIDIWAHETPLASRNFIQLCLEGYYDNTIFHRMIPGFMIQGGDPLGDGTGGQSIYGEKFKDEYHQRLKFGRRGMVAMANSGKNTNGSQFFITFGQCVHLNKKHTIFGKVVGDSIYNLLSFQSLETDANDRPVDPPYIRKTKVVLNPFDDMIPREKAPKAKNLKAVEQGRENEKKGKKEDLKKLKSKNKLTFEDEQEEIENSYKIKSSHDALDEEKLSKKFALTSEDVLRKKKQREEEESKRKKIIEKIGFVRLEEQPQKQREDIQFTLQSELQKKMKASENSNVHIEDEILEYHKVVNPETGKMEIVWGNQLASIDQKQELQNRQLQRLRNQQELQYEGLKTDELQFKKMREGSLKERRKMLMAEQKLLLSNVERRKYQFLKKNQIELREGQTFEKLSKFTARLKADQPNDWMCHRLKFHIDSENAYNLDKKNQERKGRSEDDDGGLKVEFSKMDADEIDIDQLYQLAK